MGEQTKYLIIGGGVASVAAAQAIRERDKEGRLILLTADRNMPYDHPPLSKDFLGNPAMTADDAASKFDNFYPDNNIELRRETVVQSISFGDKTATVEGGESIRYEKLLLATGARPKKLGVANEDQPGIYTLRSIDDAEAIRTSLGNGSKAIIVGGGFIGVEVASQLLQKGLEVTILCADSRLWAKFASQDLGGFLNDTLAQRGAKLILDDQATGFQSGPRVKTSGGLDLEGDMVVVGIGVDLNLELARSAGLACVPGEGVTVDEYLVSSDPDVYAAGDVAYFQDIAMGRRWHLEHHLNARWQGAVAGANMAGDTVAYDRVPYFFSDFLDLHMILRGDPDSGRNTTVLGDLSSGEFIELYFGDDGKLTMGIAFSHEEKRLDPISDRLESLLRSGAEVSGVSLSDFAQPV